MSSGSTGWKKEEYDPNDIPYRYRGKGDAYMMHNVNLIFGKPSWFHNSSGSVYDQGDSGSCVANACAAAYRYLAYKTAEEMAEADMNAHAEVKRECPLLNDPSRLFLYYNARWLSWLVDHKFEEAKGPNFGDEGSCTRLAMRGIRWKGVCSEGKCPFAFIKDSKKKVENLNTKPSEEAYSEASKVVNLVEYK
jgi:hypothetical protein